MWRKTTHLTRMSKEKIIPTILIIVVIIIIEILIIGDYQINNNNNNSNSNNKNNNIPADNRSTGSQHFQVTTTFSFLNKAKTSNENNYNNIIKDFNHNNIMKAYEEYKCAMSNNGDDQNASNLKSGYYWIHNLPLIFFAI